MAKLLHAVPMESPPSIASAYRHHDADVFMWAFDLIEFNGDDLRLDPFAVRKATLERMLARAAGTETPAPPRIVLLKHSECFLAHRRCEMMSMRLNPHHRFHPPLDLR
jgi:hypothetical protein